MITSYPACFFKEKNGYSVIFPDLNWLSTCGETEEDAFSMAVDCLAGYLYLAKKEGMDVNLPSSLGAIDAAAVAEELDYTEFTEPPFVNMVSVDVDAYASVHFEKSVKKTLTIPAWLNRLAVEQNINFSGVLQEALKEKLSVK